MSAAPLGARSAAWAIDLAVTVVVPFALYLAIAVIVFGDDVPLAVALLLIALLVLFHLLYAPLLLRRTGPGAGQTLGKQAMGVRVRGSDGGKVTFGAALKRELVGRSLLGLVPLYTVVDLLWPLGDRERRALHDLLADTMVVQS